MNPVEEKIIEFRQRFGVDPDVFLVGRDLWPKRFEKTSRVSVAGVLYVLDENIEASSVVMTTCEALWLGDGK